MRRVSRRAAALVAFLLIAAGAVVSTGAVQADTVTWGSAPIGGLTLR
jgi:hypothetical protein